MNAINRMNLANGIKSFDGDEETLIKLMSLNSVLPFVIKYDGSYTELKSRIVNKVFEAEVKNGLLSRTSVSDIIKTTWLASLLVCGVKSLEIEKVKEFINYTTNYIPEDVVKLCHTLLDSGMSVIA